MASKCLSLSVSRTHALALSLSLALSVHLLPFVFALHRVSTLFWYNVMPPQGNSPAVDIVS